jgi:hypothetical protein
VRCHERRFASARLLVEHHFAGGIGDGGVDDFKVRIGPEAFPQCG